MRESAKPRRRGKIVLALIALLLLGVSLSLGLLLLNADSLRPFVAAALSGATGLEATVEEFALDFSPSPRATLRQVRLGDEFFGATIESIDAPLALGGLWRGRLFAPEVTLNGLILWLPITSGAVAERFSEVIATGRESGGGGPGLDIGALSAPGARVHRGGAPWANATLNVTGVSLPALEATGQLELLEAPVPTRLDARIAYDKPAQSISGEVAFNGDLQSAFPDLGEQDLQLNAKATLSGSIADQVAASMEGRFSSAAYGQEGTLSALAFWKDGLVILNDAQAVSQDGKAILDMTITPGVEAAFEVYEAAVGAASLRLLSAAFAPESLRLEVDDAARFGVSELLGAWPLGESGQLRFERGVLSVGGVSVASAAVPPAFPLLRGLSAEARVEGKQLRIDTLAASGVSLNGTVTFTEEGGFDAALQGRADLAGLDVRGVEPFDAVDKLSGGIVIERLALARATGTDALRMGFQGRAEDVGFSATLPGAAQPVSAKGIHGGIAYDGASLKLNDIRAEGLSLNGSIALHDAGKPAAFQFAGDINLAHPLVALIAADTPFSGLGGRLAIARAEGQYDPATAALTGLAAEAALSGGGFRVDLGGTPVSAKDVTGEFKTADGKLNATLTLSSPELGALAWKGRLDTASMALDGTLTASLARLAGALTPGLASNDIARQVIANYGETALAVTAQLPAAGKAPSLRAAHEGKPPFAASMTFLPRDAGGYALAEAGLETTVPLDGVSAPGTLPVTAAGQGKLTFKKGSGDSSFTASATLDDAELRVGDYLRKAPGQPLRVGVTGSAESWTPERIDVDLLGQPLRLDWKEGGPATDSLNLDLAALAPLFPPEVQSRGTVRGGFQAEPLRVNLTLADVAIALSPEVRADAISGGIRYDGEAWHFDQLRVLAADSDFILDAGLRGGAWQGSLNGRRLNLNAIQAMQAAWAGDSEEESQPITLQGQIALALDEVLYRQARLTGVKANLQFASGRITLASLDAGAGGGRITGQIDYTQQPGGGRAALALTTQGVDASVIDGLLFEQPRGFQGAVDSSVNLAFPLTKDTPPYNGLDGAITFTARKGTYGQAGFATRLLSVLRTTEILRLRLPGFGDKGGLSFDESTGVINARQGFVTLESFALTAKSYAFDARGTIDFPRDTTNIEGRMNIFESVTGIVSAVPIIGGVVDRVKGQTGVAFVMTGSPFDIKVTPKPGTRPVRDTRDGVRESVNEIKALGDALGL
ncbi:MAG: hypothetical protein RLZZ303_2978 [Candidatus Hydrogenedentota bacterium]|jgi:hypothetical protein